MWTDHATFMHVYIVEALAGLPDGNRALDRLLQNQTDIGNALVPFFGLVRTETLVALLRDRALIAGDLTRSRDVTMFDGAKNRLFANADALAALFIDADPRIPVDIKALTHLQADAIIAQISARVDRQWADAVDAQDRFMLHTNSLADILGWSITTRFPDVIAPADLNPNVAQLYRDTRVMWRQNAFWTRVVVVEAVAGLPDTYMAINQLMLNVIDLGNAVKPFYTPAEGSRLTLLLATKVIATSDYIEAAKGNDPARTAALNARLYANADAIAALYGAANPGMLAEYRTLWRRDTDHMLNQINARIGSDWSNDLAAYGESVQATRTMGDTVAAGIVKQWPQAGGAVTVTSQSVPPAVQAVQLIAPVPGLPQPNPPCTSCPFGNANLLR